MTESTPPDESDYERDLRQLAMVDRILGLEAQVANLRTRNVSQALRKQLKEVKSSTTWRVGRMVLSPFFAIQSLVGGGKDKKRDDDKFGFLDL